MVLNSIPGKGHAKVLTAGIGWAGAEVLLTRFLLLWVGARGAEFDWKYIQKSLESNINLVSNVALSVAYKSSCVLNIFLFLICPGATYNHSNACMVVVATRLETGFSSCSSRHACAYRLQTTYLRFSHNAVFNRPMVDSRC